MSQTLIDDRTAHLGLRLPHPQNKLEDDAPRLRQSLLDIDARFAALAALLRSDDVDLDQLQELVNAVKSNAGGVLELLAAKAGRDELGAVIAVIADKASRSELAAVAAGAFPPAPIELNSNTQLEVNRIYHLDSRAGGFELVMPADPPPRSWVWLVDAAGACAAHPITLHCNGKTIDGAQGDWLLDVDGDSLWLFLNGNNNSGSNWTEQ